MLIDVTDEYTSTYEPEDQLEWSLVLAEIKAFVESDSLVRVLDSESNSSVVLSHRLNPMITPPLERSPVMTLSLQEVIIVGNLTDQVKFSELTLDMFRMLQTLEREPQDELGAVVDTSPAPGRIPLENGVGRAGRENPHKYLLYKPTLPQLMVFLASGYKELPPNGALLLYISADGSFPSRPNPEDTGYDMGGVLMSPKRDVEPSNNKNTGQFKEHCCLFPGDLFPFTRRPTFLILDSDNSLAFSSLPHYFDMPLVVLMSPQDVPPAFQDHCAHKGSLFTLFLHSPMAGFCFVTNIIDVPIHLWDKSLSYIDRFMTEASRLLTRCRGVGQTIHHLQSFYDVIYIITDASYINFLGDDFLRLLLCRYIFCDALLRIHRSFKVDTNFDCYQD